MKSENYDGLVAKAKAARRVGDIKYIAANAALWLCITAIVIALFIRLIAY